MTSSGSVNFDLTRNEIINDALVQCGAIAEGDSPSAAATVFAARQLNRMVKAWQTDGVHLWTRRTAILFTALSQGRYKLGPNSSEHFAALDDMAFTTLSAAAASGAATFDVASVTNMAASDNIGIVLDDGTIQWTTISSIATLTITPAASLTGAAASGNAVFAYTTALGRPLRIEGASRLSTDNTDVPMEVIGHQEYNDLPNKTITGQANTVYYQPLIPDGFIDVWPEPESANIRLRLSCVFPVEDYDASSNTSDLPQEWLDALMWNLAYRLTPSYGTPTLDRQTIREMAIATRTAVMNFDTERVMVEVQPDMMGY
jgi:hypothetical protein